MSGVVSPHLYLGDDNPPGLLIQPLIIPMRVKVGQLVSKSATNIALTFTIKDPLDFYRNTKEYFKALKG